MPHTQPRHPLDPVRLQPPIYMRDGPMQVVRYPCPCGHELCVQPVLVNNHHFQALRTAQEGQANNVEHANLGELPENVLNINRNHFAPENYVHQEPLRLEYPTYPEVQPREYRRERRRIGRNRSAVIGGEADIDR